MKYKEHAAERFLGQTACRLGFLADIFSREARENMRELGQAEFIEDYFSEEV